MSSSSPLCHQAWGPSRLQEGWGVHEVVLLLHIEQGQAWGSCGRCWAWQVDRNKAHSVPVLHKASFQLAIKQAKQRAFYEWCTLTSFGHSSTDTAKQASVTINVHFVNWTSVCQPWRRISVSVGGGLNVKYQCSHINGLTNFIFWYFGVQWEYIVYVQLVFLSKLPSSQSSSFFFIPNKVE